MRFVDEVEATASDLANRVQTVQPIGKPKAARKTARKPAQVLP